MISLFKMTEDEWYISLLCDCGERLVMFPGLTEGKGSLAGAFEVTCPACHARGCYPAEHYQYRLERAGESERAMARAS